MQEITKDGYHHQDYGRMQLVEQTTHTGGYRIWNLFTPFLLINLKVIHYF
jgi:hypothetical protein